jgi:hypothetical protein
MAYIQFSLVAVTTGKGEIRERECFISLFLGIRQAFDYFARL